MSFSLILEFLLVLVLLFLSGLISGSEIAYFSYRGSKISKLSQTKNVGLLATIIILNNLVNSYLSSISSDLFKGIWVPFVLTALVALFGELLPKRIALTYPHVFIKLTSWLYSPMAHVLSVVNLKPPGVDPPKTKLFRGFADAIKNSSLEDHERFFIAKLLGAIHVKAYTFLYVYKAAPILSPDMSLEEALLEVKRKPDYPFEWIPVRFDTDDIGFVRRSDLLSGGNLKVGDLEMVGCEYLPLLSSFSLTLEKLLKDRKVCLVDEFGTLKGFAFKESIVFWMLSKDEFPLHTSLLEIFVMTNVALGDLDWDLAHLLQYYKMLLEEESEDRSDLPEKTESTHWFSSLLMVLGKGKPKVAPGYKPRIALRSSGDVVELKVKDLSLIYTPTRVRIKRAPQPPLRS